MKLKVIIDGQVYTSDEHSIIVTGRIDQEEMAAMYKMLIPSDPQGCTFALGGEGITAEELEQVCAVETEALKTGAEVVYQTPE